MTIAEGQERIRILAIVLIVNLSDLKGNPVLYEEASFKAMSFKPPGPNPMSILYTAAPSIGIYPS